MSRGHTSINIGDIPAKKEVDARTAACLKPMTKDE
jgi:hypothetical protein